MAEEDRDAKFRAQTGQQFEALGRFVQSFELMVDAVRNTCYFSLSLGNPKQGQVVNVVLFHQSMTAKPLFEIMRGIYAMQIKEWPEYFKDNEAEVIHDVLSYCAREYEALSNVRNDLLHGTWHIGWASADQDDFSEMHVQKFRVGKTGYKLAELPKSAEELNALVTRIDDLTKLINRIFAAAHIGHGRGSRVRFNVRNENGRWLPEPPKNVSKPDSR